MELPLNTGERILLEKESPLMIARHFCAYKFAEDYAAGRSVLDIGCGEGYGAHFLAGSAGNVMGIDYEASVIDYAKEKYRRDNLVFCSLDIKELTTLNKKFEVICCFQVIEHIQDTQKFLESVSSLLSENGVFICSTPNRLDASPHGSVPANKFHVREYLRSEFEELLKRHFAGVKIFGLKRGGRLKFYRRLKKIGLFNFLPRSLDPVKDFYKRISYRHFDLSKGPIDLALDFIALCEK